MTSDTEVARNPHQPEGWWRDGINFFCRSFSAMHTDIASSLLRELDAVALATNVTIFMERGTYLRAVVFFRRFFISDVIVLEID